MTVRAPLVPGRQSPWRAVPPQIPRPEYVGKKRPKEWRGSHVQTPETIERMRIAGRLAAQATQLAGEHCKPGVTTDEIDKVVHEFLCDHGAYPSTLGYKGFPKSCCTSLNEVICHGIPDSTLIENGDIVNINVIGRVIESYAKRFGYGVVRDFTGHGIGGAFHSGLVVLHYDEPSVQTLLEEGMTFTIEPMITLGTVDYDIWDDGWTVVTKDRARTAQFEHTVLVTGDGVEILTLP